MGLIKTSRKTNTFRIISKNKVEFDNGNRRVNMYRQKNKITSTFFKHFFASYK